MQVFEESSGRSDLHVKMIIQAAELRTGGTEGAGN